MTTGCAVAFLAVSSQGAIASVVQFLVPPSMRSVAAAVKHLFVTALGAGLGPLIVGVISDHLAARFGNEAIRYSLAAASTFWALSGLLFIYASRTFVEDVRRAEAPALESK
jgi:MFS family permease